MHGGMVLEAYIDVDYVGSFVDRRSMLVNEQFTNIAVVGTISTVQ